uniref:(northern house mosquito) hypothetical protein n=1 Tax=Culex pipiens TaxID=7175 RepID=A0A8D8P1N1_CULPI
MVHQRQEAGVTLVVLVRVRSRRKLMMLRRWLLLLVRIPGKVRHHQVHPAGVKHLIVLAHQQLVGHGRGRAGREAPLHLRHLEPKCRVGTVLHQAADAATVRTGFV